MRVFRMGIFGVHMVMIMVVMMVMAVIMVMVVAMVVIVAVVMIVIVVMMVMPHIQAAFACAERVAQLAIRHVRAGRRGSLPFHVVVMAFLHCTDFGLESQNLDAVFAHHAGGRRDVCKRGMLFALFDWDGLGLATVHRQNLRAIATGAAVWRAHVAQLLGHALCEGFQHFRVIVQIAGFDEMDARVFRRQPCR